MIIKKLDWLGGWEHVGVESAEYKDGSRAVRLITDDLEVLSVASTNLSGYGIRPIPGCFFIKDYSEHEGLAAALVAAGVVVPTGRAVRFGPYNTGAGEYRFTPEFEVED